MRALHYEESLSSWEVAAYARPKLSIRITDGCYRLVTHIPVPVGLAIEAPVGQPHRAEVAALAAYWQTHEAERALVQRQETCFLGLVIVSLSGAAVPEVGRETSLRTQEVLFRMRTIIHCQEPFMSKGIYVGICRCRRQSKTSSRCLSSWATRTLSKPSRSSTARKSAAAR